ALLCGLYAARTENALVRGGYALLAVLLAITLLPPVEFFKGAWDDANYRQQFGIAVISVIGLVVIAVAQWRSRLQKYQRRLEITALLLCMICAIVGNILALNVVRSYQIDATLGGGMIVLIISLALSLIASG